MFVCPSLSICLSPSLSLSLSLSLSVLVRVFKSKSVWVPLYLIYSFSWFVLYICPLCVLISLTYSGFQFVSVWLSLTLLSKFQSTSIFGGWFAFVHLYLWLCICSCLFLSPSVSVCPCVCVSVCSLKSMFKCLIDRSATVEKSSLWIWSQLMFDHFCSRIFLKVLQVASDQWFKLVFD